MRHEEHAGGEDGALWYANEGFFVEEIPEFDATDYFVMRCTATPPAPGDTRPPAPGANTRSPNSPTVSVTAGPGMALGLG